MTKEELTKLLMEAYERGQSDLIKSCQEAASIAVDTAILAEREACAKLCDVIAQKMDDEGEGPTGNIGWVIDCAEAIRARGQA